MFGHIVVHSAYSGVDALAFGVDVDKTVSTH